MTDHTNSVELAAELTAAWLANPNTRPNVADVPAFLVSIHDALTRLHQGSVVSEAEATQPAASAYEPATTMRKSLASPDHIISMIDGKKYRTLRRHLKTNGITPEEYRERYGLRADYPMVAPTYSEARRAMAKSIGLGRKSGTNIEQGAKTVTKPVSRGVKAALEAAKAALGTAD